MLHLLVICCKYMQNARYTQFQDEELFVRMAGFGPSPISEPRKYEVCITYFHSSFHSVVWFPATTFATRSTISQSNHLFFPFGCVENGTSQMTVVKSRKTYLKSRLVDMQMHLLFDSAGYRWFYLHKSVCCSALVLKDVG